MRKGKFVSIDSKMFNFSALQPIKAAGEKGEEEEEGAMGELAGLLVNIYNNDNIIFIFSYDMLIKYKFKYILAS